MPKTVAPTVLCCAIDDVAYASLRGALRAAGRAEQRCDGCGEPIRGRPAATGLFLWTRGDEMRFDEPPLCPRCAAAIGATAFQHETSCEGEEEG
ncbi:MAG: hypothetical protein HY744_34330 [Deltaproteobacteria bacterium]|nr:hypothetical protein [Deltaproteobacteria bacterium]